MLIKFECKITILLLDFCVREFSKMTTGTKSKENFIENVFIYEPPQEDEVSKVDPKSGRKYGSSFLLCFASFTGNNLF